MAKKRKTKKSNLIRVNFDGVKSIKTPDEGAYLLRIVEAEQGISKSDEPKIDLTCEVAEGKFEGSKVWHTLSFAEKALWRTRDALEAMGVDVIDGEMEIDAADLVDREFGANLFHDTYEGTKRAKIADFLEADEVDEEENDVEDEDTDDEDEDLDIDSMDEDELEELIADKGLDVDLDDFKGIKKKRKAVIDALEDEGDDEEDDEDNDDEEESYSEADLKKMSIEELEDLNDDLDLGIEDLEDMTKKKALRNVIKALKKKDLFEE